MCGWVKKNLVAANRKWDYHGIRPRPCILGVCNDPQNSAVFCSSIRFRNLGDCLNARARHCRIWSYNWNCGGRCGFSQAVDPLPEYPNLGRAVLRRHPAVSGPAGAATMTPEAAAKANLQFFQTHAGPTAAEIAVRTVPDHASTWIDGKFVGPAPLTIKLAPGHHQILVRAISMHEYTQEFDLAAKQRQSIDVALKTGCSKSGGHSLALADAEIEVRVQVSITSLFLPCCLPTSQRSLHDARQNSEKFA